MPTKVPAGDAVTKRSMFSWSYWQEGGKDTSRSEIVRNLGLLAVGIVGLVFGIWRAYTAHTQAKASAKQAETGAQVHVTSSFTAAVEQLGNKQLPVRMGGIYALWRLAEDSPERHTVTVIDILCAFARNPPHGPATSLQLATRKKTKAGNKQTKDSGPNVIPRLRSDVQAILTLIGRNSKYRKYLSENYRLNFQSADLSLADLRETEFNGADLGGAIFFAAFLTDANLEKVNLIRANLEGAYLDRANLIHADLRSAVMARCSLVNACLIVADLAGTNLRWANLYRANLEGANLEGANLEGANLEGANLERVNLGGANLLGVAGLTQKQLNTAYIAGGKEPPMLPPGFDASTIYIARTSGD
ncbi:MAG: pentapeptide repeat-containing protein [Candidatus Kerfeldbacteria bacterium]|nr:pentapeptide repeat-containing protein [Candidatus Kerfeldbacteria bacterium]